MKTTMYVAALTLLLSPAMLNAQSAEATTQSRARANANAQARIDAAMTAAAKARVPAALLQSKVREGEAKRVPQDRIATAVEARLQALLRAQSTMRKAGMEFSNDSEIAVASEALQAGVSEKALVSVYRDAPAERRIVAVAVLTDLVRLGAASETALARVNAAARSNAGLANLNAEVASKMRLGGLGRTLDAEGILKIR